MSEHKPEHQRLPEFFNEPFRPPLGLRNPHAQTIFSSMGRKLLKPKWQAEFLAQAQVREMNVAGVKLVVHTNFQKINSNQTPLIMMIPGWLGNVESTYDIPLSTTDHCEEKRVQSL